MSNMRHPVVISALAEEDGGGYIAYSPDLPGCLADGDTPDEALAAFRDALSEWVDEVRRGGLETPAPWSSIEARRTRNAAVENLVHQQHEIIKRQEELIAKFSEITREMLDQLQRTATLDNRWAEIGIIEGPAVRRVDLAFVH